MMARVYIFYSEEFHTVFIAHVQYISYYVSTEINISMQLMTESEFPIFALERTTL